jgi:flagellar basal-body rod protein FlgF
MNEASISALWHQTTLTRRMDMIADNIANASTPGFKSEMLVFQLRPESHLGGVRLVEETTVARDPGAGGFTQTGQGEGYFAIETPLGERFTRNGRFTIDGEGQLVTSSGYPVLADDGQPIVFAPTETDIEIGADGTVSSQSGEIATIGVVKFSDDNLLRRTPDGFFAADAEPEPALEAKLSQGFIEQSNVQPVAQMTEMMQVLRDFRAAQQVIQDEHDRERRMIQALTGSN